MSKYKHERRQKRAREQRRVAFIIISIAVVLMVLIIALPTLIDAATPVGEIVQITPVDRPMVSGKTMGNPEAPVVIEVFEDFQCSACASYTFNTEKQIITDLIPTGQVLYIFRQYPFLDNNSSIKESDQAASASMCAMEQERFWDYHDMLYTNQSGENVSAFSDKRLIAFADALGLDVPAFKSCFEENRYQDQIDQDFAAGDKLEVTGTPSVFVNGKVIKPGYVPSYSDIKEAVDAALGN